MYSISHVDRKHLELWHDFWDSTSGPSKEAIEVNRDGSLGLKEPVEAMSLGEAIQQIELKYPNHVVIKNACSRIGT